MSAATLKPRPGNALDAEFTLDTITNLDAVFARRAEASRLGFERFEAIRDIRYGDGPGETLILFPAQSERAPVQLFIHGGFWSSMEAAQFGFLARGFIPFGAALIVIDYPLIPNVRMEDIVRSCRCAVEWIWRNGAAHGLDPDRIFLSGNSAGGHLVAELMDRDWLGAVGLPSNVIKGGTAISGLFDLKPVQNSFRNELLQFTDDDVSRFSPARRAIDVAKPIIVAVGGAETGEFLRQSADYAAQCEKAGAPTEQIVVPHADHITVVLDAFSDPNQPLNRAVRRQMGLSG